PRIGYLSAGPSGPSPNIEGFREGLRALGYVEGQNIAIEYRYAAGRDDRLADLAAELVRLKVDLIVTDSSPAARAAQKATKTIPIVMAASGDPIGTGLIASLSRPGGNITGLTHLSPELSGKRLELLKEVVPKASRVAILWNAANPDKVSDFRETEAAARALRVQLQSLEVRGAEDFDKAFAAATSGRAHALITLSDPLTGSRGRRILDFALKNRLPAMYGERGFVDAGGLMSYGHIPADLHRRAATFVDKILKGTKPADLPVEQPVKFEFVINLKTAKQIGLTIPPNVLVRADKVIK
ncbi:MAG: ABC transporter substrate-binding protein, partial [Candidatus Binatia bacterium]